MKTRESTQFPVTDGYRVITEGIPGAHSMIPLVRAVENGFYIARLTGQVSGYGMKYVQTRMVETVRDARRYAEQVRETLEKNL